MVTKCLPPPYKGR